MNVIFACFSFQIINWSHRAANVYQTLLVTYITSCLIMSRKKKKKEQKRFWIQQCLDFCIFITSQKSGTYCLTVKLTNNNFTDFNWLRLFSSNCTLREFRGLTVSRTVKSICWNVNLRYYAEFQSGCHFLTRVSSCPLHVVFHLHVWHFSE